jgi:two-component system, OmpR family, response regulator
MSYPSDALPVPSTGPYVLVADDDAASRCFLGNALHQLGARVATSPDGSSALEQARGEAFDLLLLDCRMPDMDGLSVLNRLRHDPDARSMCSPAVASSAELDANDQRALLAAGFIGVLLKPCTLVDLQSILRFATADRRHLPILDDDLALKAGGAATVVHALRGLFRHELLNMYQQLDDLSSDASAFDARLHKLRSSCGFCGAPSLAEHAALLQQHLKLAHQGVMLPLAEFRQSLLRTIEALEAS